jgi:acyl carrier protein
MEKAEIAEKIRAVVASVVKHENFVMTDELKASDVEGWDSLTHMVIITSIEEQFKIRFRLKELNKLQNIGSLVELIQSKL